jgi:putative cardiolipin synthase
MARAELIRNAQTSLDLQYYIVHDGISTRMLVDELLTAADRGVRVRILLDDTTSDGLDQIIATLAAHPQIQIRLFKPLAPGAQHRRDGGHGPAVQPIAATPAHAQQAVAGGQQHGDSRRAQPGDEYFDAEPNLNFTDIDMLSVGPVAEQLGHSFDQYWNSALSKPIADFISSAPSSRDLATSARAPGEVPGRVAPAKPCPVQPSAHYQTQPRMDIWRRELIWAWNQALWDAPSKVLAKADPDPQLLLTTQLGPELEGVHSELMMISAYFVPGQPGLVYLTGRADAGVDVRLLDQTPWKPPTCRRCMAAMPPYRKALLEHGVKLYELAPPTGRRAAAVAPHLLGSRALHGSDSSLHSKAMIFDRQKSFYSAHSISIRARCCGTPRSGCWWTVLSWPKHVRNLALQGMAPALSYEAKLQEGQVVWVTEDNGQLHTLTREPGSWWRRLNAWFATTVGLERML